MEIIEFNYDYDVFFNESDLLYEGIKYFEDGRGFTIYEVLEFIVEFYGVTGFKGAETVDEALLKGADSLPKDIRRGIIEEIEEWTEEEFDSIEQLIEDGYCGEILSFIHHEIEHNQLEDWVMEGLLPSNSFQSGVVGYSQWALFIAHEETNVDYIRSIWDGTNFYVISNLDDKGEIKDSVGWYYAPDMATLLSYVTDIIGDKPFKVVDNEIADLMVVPKVEKIEHVEYSFKDIE